MVCSTASRRRWIATVAAVSFLVVAVVLVAVGPSKMSSKAAVNMVVATISRLVGERRPGRPRQQQQHQDREGRTKPAVVLIIGGGISGLAAARALEDAAADRRQQTLEFDVTLLEAKPRLGGRLWTIEMTSDSAASANTSTTTTTAVDMGGTYWHGESPVLRELHRQLQQQQQHEGEEQAVDATLPWTVPSGGTSAHPGRDGALWMEYTTATAGSNDDGDIFEWVELSEWQVEQVQAVYAYWNRTVHEYYRQYNDAHSNMTAKEVELDPTPTSSRSNSAPPTGIASESHPTNDKNEHTECSPTGTVTCPTPPGNSTISPADSQVPTRQQHTKSALLTTWTRTIRESLPEQQRRWLDFELTMAFDLDNGVPLEQMNFDGFDTDWDWVPYDGDDVVARMGMGWVVDRLVADLRRTRILTNRRVTRILYEENSCRVEVSDSGSGEAASHVIEADACIVTIPIGVLKERHGKLFEPPLPEEKRQALDRAGVGVYNTLVVRWDRPICTSTAQYLIGHPDDANPLQNGYVCPGLLRDSDDASITQFYLFGAEYDFDNQTYWKEQAVGVVRAIEPSITADDIVDLNISRWHLDEETRGSYSAATHGVGGNVDRETLAQAVHQSLYFAGEHTHYLGRYQTMDGAYETGVAAAQQVLQHLSR